jgi:hypothetical protein
MPIAKSNHLKISSRTFDLTKEPRLTREGGGIPSEFLLNRRFSTVDSLF